MRGPDASSAWLANVAAGDPRHTSCRLALSALVLVAALSSCGGSSTGSPSASAATGTSAPTATAPLLTPTATSAGAVECPTAAVAGSALGMTLPSPVRITGGSNQLPLGATGIVCNYHGASFNVLIEVITNISPSLISQYSARFPAAFASVSGVGDQARSFSVPINGGDNEGIVATKGSTLVSVVATLTPASLAQVEALVNTLLG